MNIENLCGWNADLCKENFKLISSSIPKYSTYIPVDEPRGKRRMLWEYTRLILGKDTPNYGQEIGDCVSFGHYKNPLEYLQCVEIALNKDAEKFRPIFPPYMYGISRVQIGGRRLIGDGSIGDWARQGAERYGVLAADEPNVPRYSGRIAKDWGRSGPPTQFINIAKNNLIKSTALITTVNEAADALWKGYPIGIASNQGFSMHPSSDGFHRPSGRWAHSMCLIGFEDHPDFGMYFIILNSWGDAHGRLKDTTGQDLPVGVLRVKGSIIQRMLAENDSFAFSQFDGYPDNSERLDKALFKLGGL